MNDHKRFDWLAKSTLPHAYYPLRFVKDILDVLLGWITLPTNIFLSYSFGYRYLTLDRVIFAVLSISIFSSVSWLILGFMTQYGMRSGRVGGESFSLFILLFLLMAAWQGWQNHKRPYYQHSRSFGISRLLPVLKVIAALLPFDTSDDIWLGDRLNWLAYRLLHPALVFTIGWLIKNSFDPAFGLYVQISAAAIFIEAQLAYTARKYRYYDHLDALLDALALQMMLEGKPAPQRAGVHAIPMTAESFPIDPLDIEASLQAIMGQSEDSGNDDTDSR